MQQFNLNPFVAKVCMKELGLIPPFIGLKVAVMSFNNDVMPCAVSHHEWANPSGICCSRNKNRKMGPPLISPTYICKSAHMAATLFRCLSHLFPSVLLTFWWGGSSLYTSKSVQLLNLLAMSFSSKVCVQLSRLGSYCLSQSFTNRLQIWCQSLSPILTLAQYQSERAPPGWQSEQEFLQS